MAEWAAHTECSGLDLWWGLARCLEAEGHLDGDRRVQLLVGLEEEAVGWSFWGAVGATESLRSGFTCIRSSAVDIGFVYVCCGEMLSSGLLAGLPR